jgi:L-ascorbate metabolism protein UlaG (beta-lactamase superfamily)
VRLGDGLRSMRLTDPAVEIDALPALDLVVLSHLHEDHWDRVAEARLARTAVRSAHLEARVRYLAHGESYDFDVPAGRRAGRACGAAA